MNLHHSMRSPRNHFIGISTSTYSVHCLRRRQLRTLGRRRQHHQYRGQGITHVKPATTAVYTATKGALEMITSVLAKELGPQKYPNQLT